MKLINSYNSGLNSYYLSLSIDGQNLTAILSTGSAYTTVSYEAARKLGLSDNDFPPSDQRTGKGIGGEKFVEFMYKFKTLDIGGEVIRNPTLRVARTKPIYKRVVVGSLIPKDPIEEDVTLGLDFFLKNHVRLAFAQRKMYFTPYGVDMDAGSGATQSSSAPAATQPVH